MESIGVNSIPPKDAVSIGIVIRVNCVTIGHSLCVISLLTSISDIFVPQINQKANLASLLKLRADI